ncbi:glycoside hydrolase family 108 protein [Methylomonas sp. MED-D]|uniref:glycoside hydrolase family 108 protein n=1 Tax=Methylomonas sp. MED-D TaxID=3418768 RepID=UPI003CFC6F85
MTINQIITAILNREGGYVNHPADRGGPTNYGITLKTLESYLGRACTATDVQQIDRRTAYEIYYRHYYQVPRICDLPEALQPVLTDMAVNHGPNRAVILLQEVLLCHGKPIGRADGRIGQQTIGAAQQCWDDLGNDLLRTLVQRRVTFYESIVKHDETQREFLRGWIRRAEEFLPEREA